MMGLLDRIRAALPWVKPEPVDPNSLGAILGEALQVRDSSPAPVVVQCPAPIDKPHPLDLSLCDWPLDNAGGLALICLAKQFCAEMGGRGFDPVEVWDRLASLPLTSLDDLRSPEGWATLSALVTAGRVVLRVNATNPHQEVTRMALQFAHAVADRTDMTVGAVYDVLIALPDDVLALVYHKASWPDLERVVAGGAPHSAWTH